MEKPDDIFQQKEYSSGKKLFVFIVCLIIAFFIWLFSQNKHENQKQYFFHLSFHNLPVDLILTGASDSVIQVTANSEYWLFNSNASLNFNFPVDVSKLKFVKKNGYYESVYYTSNLLAFVKDKIPSNVKLTNISPRFIVFRFEDYEYKEVPVKYDEVHTLESQYGLSLPIKYSAEKVILEGNHEMLKNIFFVKTFPVRSYNIKHSQSVYVAIDTTSFSSEIRVNPSKVKISYFVEAITECEFLVPVEVVSTGVEKRNIKVFPSMVKIYMDVPLNKAKYLKKEHFTAQVSVSASQKNLKLPVKIVKLPQFITIKKVEPSTLEYLIFEK